MEADGSGSMLDLARQQPAAHDTVARADDDLACLLYTSGTTGRSKGAMLTHKNLSSNAEVLHAYWKFQKGDVLLHALPIFHTHGLFVALHTAFLNASMIHWLTRFDLDAVMKLLPQSTVMMGVPTFYTRLLGTPAFTQDHCSKMRLFISGSAPLLAETHQEFEARTGQRILERYGMTEAGMITSNPYANDGRVAGSVGYALPGIELRVAAENGRVLPTGEVGVLEMRGPNLFKGYWRNPEKTKEEFRDDGFFITGDLATIDADGRVTIVGRAKDLIISGGFNVYPKEIETEINLLPGVAESAVLGVPHPDFGEGVIAVVTPAAGASLPGEEQLIGTLSERLAKFKLPKRVFVKQELPRNAMGKVQKAELRDRYSALFKS
jgi:malonyl-CoA/methylmalonyl-CoA synthetase